MCVPDDNDDDWTVASDNNDDDPGFYGCVSGIVISFVIAVLPTKHSNFS